MSLHDAQELDNDLGRRTDEDLALATALGDDDVVEVEVVLRRGSNVTYVVTVIGWPASDRR